MANEESDRANARAAATTATSATINEPFPPAIDDGCEPYRRIAKRWDVDEEIVSGVFRGLGLPEWAAREHLGFIKEHASELNRAARSIEKLVGLLNSFPQSERDLLVQSGCVTIYQLEHLHFKLTEDSSYFGGFLQKSENSRRGGRNPATYIVAEGMRRLFRRLRKPITFGVTDSTLPSTDFCRAVEHAIGAFHIVADWRGPANEALDKQLQIQNRFHRCLTNHHRRNGLFANSEK